MKNSNEVGKGGNPYNPSSRKSIHSDRRENSGIEMGVYGLKKKLQSTSRGSPSGANQGIDEVDNALSKLCYEISPPPSRKNKMDSVHLCNTHHYSDPETSDDDEPESDRLSKSLPANVLQYDFSNKNVSHQSQGSDYHRAQNSISFSESRTDRNTSNEYSNISSSNSSSIPHVKEMQDTRNNVKPCQPLFFTIFIAILGIAIYWQSFSDSAPPHKNSVYDEFQFTKEMNYLGEKYKISDNSILEVLSGISTILQRNDTGSFIFVYNGNSAKFNDLQFSNFMQEIASAAARYLRNNTTQMKPTVLHSSELDVQSHSDLMQKYRHEVAKTGVLLVKDLDRMPSNLAMAFHYFCDEYNPLVAKSAIFFTLNVARCSNLQERKSTHNTVEKCLANLWSTVPKDNIKPLLARVVNVVIDVTQVL